MLSLGEEEIKSGQYADDLWTTLEASKENLNNILTELECFRHFYGLTINSHKTAVMKLGHFKDSDAKYYTLKQLYWSPSSVKILGFFIHPNRETMMQENYWQTLTKVNKVIEHWSNRNTTLIGKIIVVNVLINTLFVHKF